MYLFMYSVRVCVCTCVCLCVLVWMHKGHSMCTKVREQLPGISFSLSLVNLDDQTRAIRFGSKPLYLLSHLINPRSFFFS